MKMKRGILLLTTACALFAACSKPATETAAVETAVDATVRGAELLAPFKSDLKQALTSGMQEGPAAAIEVCSELAPRIAASLSVDGVKMGRSSHKLRNPDNVAPDWLVPLIDGYASGGNELVPHAVALDHGRTGYAEPIIVQPVCLTCHGTELDEGVAAQIAALYPEDQATGFNAGDFRGVFWVEFQE
jgi:hypothetical protein